MSVATYTFVFVSTNSLYRHILGKGVVIYCLLSSLFPPN